MAHSEHLITNEIKLLDLDPDNKIKINTLCPSLSPRSEPRPSSCPNPRSRSRPRPYPSRRLRPRPTTSLMTPLGLNLCQGPGSMPDSGLRPRLMTNRGPPSLGQAQNYIRDLSHNSWGGERIS